MAYSSSLQSRELPALLQNLKLRQFYPEKMSRNDLYQITPESLCSDKSNCSPAWQFIYKLTRYNYEARNIQLRDSDETNSSVMGLREYKRNKEDQQRFMCHPLDIIAAVFLCCNPVARQDLVMHLWGCKLAVPLVLKSVSTDKPTAYVWPLRSLIGSYGDGEMPIVTKEMSCIAFVRVGENRDISKSFLLNCLIGGPEKPHPVFFHRNSEGSIPTRSNVANEMIEVAWFIPSESEKKRFNEPRVFANLRGNASDLMNEVGIIGHLATVTIVLCDEHSYKDTKRTIEILLHHGSSVILLITGQTPNIRLIVSYIDKHFDKISHDKLDIVTLAGCMLSGLLDRVHHNIKKMENVGKKKSCLIDQIKELPKETVTVDETKFSYVKALKASNVMIAEIKAVPDISRRDKFLPLQEKYWKEWSRMDKDFHRFDQLDLCEKETYGSKDKLKIKLIQIRNEQYRFLKKNGLSRPLQYFVEAMSQFELSTKKIFLRQIKLELDNLSRKQLQPLFNKYLCLLESSVSLNAGKRKKVNEDLSELDVQISKLSFGLEHIMREIGQVYEACDSQPKKNTELAKFGKNTVDHNQLPKYACFSMIEGYPLEVLDGEASSVPLVWIKRVLSWLPYQIDNNYLKTERPDPLHVHIVSVLGIQSSGKSTFLNTMFGLQFAVSAGRCTRGAFLQLVKVSKSVTSGKTEYILAIDTEGLKSAELTSSESIINDNELCTFVIGLADTTIINLMGENTTYLQENLPIAVHAFLRMNMVGLHPRCSIVHHNVNKRNKDKLLQQGRSLKIGLDTLTKKACDMERIPEKSFHDIIEFSISGHIDYVPSLYEGEQPMAPVSNGYSNESDEIRSKLVQFMKEDCEVFTLSYFTGRLEKLWKAIKTDRFVYEFRTTLEAEAKLEQDNGFSGVMLNFFLELDKIFVQLLPKVKARKSGFDSVTILFNKAIKKVEKKCEKELINFHELRKKISWFNQWKNQSLEAFKSETEHHKNTAIAQLKDFYYQANQPISMDKMETFFEKVLQMKQTSKQSLEGCFQQVWKQWIRSLNLVCNEDTVVADTIKALQQVRPSQIHCFTEKILTNISLDKFKPSEKKHLSNRDKASWKLIQKMKSIQNLVETEYDILIKQIRQNRLAYSDRNPKHILMKIGDILSKTLKKENTTREINNTFEIDILISTAGSVINEFRGKVECDIHLDEIKKEMLRMTLKKAEKLDTESDRLTENIFDVIELIVMSQVRPHISNFLLSPLNNIIRSKETLLGRCILHIFETNDEYLLKLYTTSPEVAVSKYVQILLLSVIKKREYFKSLRDYMKSRVDMLLSPILDIRSLHINTTQILAVILEHSELGDLEEQLLKFRLNATHCTVDRSYLRNTLLSKRDHVIKHLTEKVVDIIIAEQSDHVPIYAEKICRYHIGCVELCPFCREICRYSKGHIGAHECFIHRPVVFAGFSSSVCDRLSHETCIYHLINKSKFQFGDSIYTFNEYRNVHKRWKIMPTYEPESSKIWQWILINKYSVFTEDETVVNTAPENWKLITADEVKRAIKKKYIYRNTELCI